MAELVDHLAELTGFRDRELLDVTLVGALRDLLRPRAVAIYRSVGEAGQERWLTRARLSHDDLAASADPAWIDLDGLPRHEEHPHRLQAFHDQAIEERIEAGLALEGWEAKSLRAGKVQLKESYVLLKDGESWLFGCHISPLLSASTHVHPDATRTRKLLLHREQILQLVIAVERRGYTLIPLSLYWKKGRAKLEIGVARGKKDYDKRATEKERDWEREKGRLMRHQ